MSFAFALFFPPVYIVATHAVLYDNIRHVLFLIPLLAVVAGIALDRFDRLLRPAKAQRAAAWAVAGAFLTYHVGVMVALHPNQYIYLNAFVGGVPGGRSGSTWISGAIRWPRPPPQWSTRSWRAKARRH